MRLFLATTLRWFTLTSATYRNKLQTLISTYLLRSKAVHITLIQELNNHLYHREGEPPCTFKHKSKLSGRNMEWEFWKNLSSCSMSFSLRHLSMTIFCPQANTLSSFSPGSTTRKKTVHSLASTNSKEKRALIKASSLGRTRTAQEFTEIKEFSRTEIAHRTLLAFNLIQSRIVQMMRAVWIS